MFLGVSETLYQMEGSCANWDCQPTQARGTLRPRLRTPTCRFCCLPINQLDDLLHE